MRERLREARLRLGWTQEQAATAAGISRQHFSQIEEGGKDPSLDAARKIARALASGMDELFHTGESTGPAAPACVLPIPAPEGSDISA